MDNPSNTDPENGIQAAPKMPLSKNEYYLKTFHSTGNMLAHIMIGFIVGVPLLFSFRSGPPTGSTPVHIILCVLGYQLLMAEAILSLSPYNGWSAHLKLVDKRRAHWILQILGSVLAIAGSFIKIADKTSHWTSLHGQFALVALVFTVVSLVNGLASLWAYELKFIPAILSKATHICFGAVGFAAAGISLCYGFEKTGFRAWTGDGMAYTLIGLTGSLTVIIIFSPLITLIGKFKRN